MPNRHQAAATVAGRPTTPTTPEPEESSFDGKVRPSLQNTYRMEPKRPWSEEAALQCLRDVMHEKLDAAEYEADKCGDLAASVAAEVRTRLRELNFDRYRIVCVVQVYEKLFQGIRAEVGYLWDTQRDHHASYSMSGLHIVASGTVFGVYYE